MEIENELKEFIEDNLITDEGYRTKYALKKIDERIKPGIELLKQKYLLREEGSFIELTHDVIVTLVKSDREERRKKLALARERIKAKRKMRIIVLFVFFAVAAGGGVAYHLITKQANKEKKEAFAQRDQAKAESRIIQVKNDSLRKDSVKLERFIRKKAASVNDTTIKTYAVTVKNLGDTIIDLKGLINSLNMHLSTNNKSYNDSIASLQQSVTNYRNVQIDLKGSVERLTRENDILKPQVNELNISFGNKEKDYSSKINGLETQVGLLQKTRDSLQNVIARNNSRFTLQYKNLSGLKNKKKIYGYGYDYHPFLQLGKD